MTTPEPTQPRPLDQPPSPWGSVVPPANYGSVVPPSPVPAVPAAPVFPVSDAVSDGVAAPVQDQPTYAQPSYGTPAQPYSQQSYTQQPYSPQPTPYGAPGYAPIQSPYVPDPEQQRRRASARNRRLLFSLIPFVAVAAFIFLAPGHRMGFSWFIPVFILIAIVGQIFNQKNRR